MWPRRWRTSTPVFPAGGELGPVAGHRSGELELAAVSQDEGTQRRHRLGDRPDVGDGVALPGNGALLVEVATPDVDHRHAVDEDRHRGADIEPVVEIGGQRVTHPGESFLAHSRDLGQLSPSGLSPRWSGGFTLVATSPFSVSRPRPPDRMRPCHPMPASRSWPPFASRPSPSGATWSAPGMGHAKAGATGTRLAGTLPRGRPLAVVGIAGGLESSLEPGQLVVADALHAPDGADPIVLPQADAVAAALRGHGRDVRVGAVACSTSIVHGAARDRSGARRRAWPWRWNRSGWPGSSSITRWSSYGPSATPSATASCAET